MDLHFFDEIEHVFFFCRNRFHRSGPRRNARILTDGEGGSKKVGGGGAIECDDIYDTRI